MAFLCEVLGHTLPKAGPNEPVPKGVLDDGPFDYVTLPDVRDVRMNCGRCSRPFTVCKVRVPPSERQHELERFAASLRQMLDEAAARKPHHR